MAKEGPIILVEDDEDDVHLLSDIFLQLDVHNEVCWFNTTRKAWQFLQETPLKPFIILCDMNLPLQNGLEFKKAIDGDPGMRRKSIPFIFYSTAVEQRYIDTAYAETTVQGFFQKGYDYQEIIRTIRTIVEYWKLSRHPYAGS